MKNEKLKRIHLFEFEDFAWFPRFFRDLLTDFIVAIHRTAGSGTHIRRLLNRLIVEKNYKSIVDLCSGAGGPMPDVFHEMKAEHPDLKMNLTDLYPNSNAAKHINTLNKDLVYLETPVNAAQVPEQLKGIRTMVGSFHHMPVEVAKGILKSAFDAKQPIMIFELSNNAGPKVFWWAPYPILILVVLLVMPAVRPFKWQHFVFTYIIPVLPFLIAWDGLVSNARTYTVNDLKILTSELQDPGYTWEIGTVKARAPGLSVYLLGIPK